MRGRILNLLDRKRVDRLERSIEQTGSVSPRKYRQKGEKVERTHSAVRLLCYDFIPTSISPTSSGCVDPSPKLEMRIETWMSVC